MNKLSIDIENCYGIKKLKAELDFSQNKAYAIYAANGAIGLFFQIFMLT